MKKLNLLQLILFLLLVTGVFMIPASEHARSSAEEELYVHDDGAAEEEKWIPFEELQPEQVELKAIVREEEAWIQVRITFPTSGYRVNWGKVDRDNNTFSADAQVDMYTGPVLQVITEKRHRYELGPLEKGERYRFLFKNRGDLIASIYFSGECIIDTPSLYVDKDNNRITEEEYSFSVGYTACEQGHAIEYRFDWGDVENLGDNNYSAWRENPSTAQSWSYEGVYEVRVQVRCTENPANVSFWSDKTEVEIGEPTLIRDWDQYY